MNTVDEKGNEHIKVGKLNLVDLAGSERASKTGDKIYVVLKKKKK